MFTYIATILFLFLTAIWTTDTLLNIGMKFVFICMSVFGIVNSLQLLGYIVKV